MIEVNGALTSSQDTFPYFLIYLLLTLPPHMIHALTSLQIFSCLYLLTDLLLPLPSQRSSCPYLLTDLLQLGHPAGGQVTVLQHHPGAVQQGRFHHPHRDGALGSHTQTHNTPNITRYPYLGPWAATHRHTTRQTLHAILTWGPGQPHTDTQHAKHYTPS